MPVPAAKVKALCSSTEAELVRNSRPPQIKSLSLAEVKAAKARARKLADKWQGQLHKQARAKKGAKGVSASDANTQLKAEIFREALNAYEARQAELEAKGAKPTSSKKTPTKKARAASHRGARAAIRDELALVGDVLNRGAKMVKNTVLNAAASMSHRNANPGPTAGAPASAAEAATSEQVKKAAKPAKKVKKAAPPAKAGLAKPSKAKQVKVTAKAKQTRLATSGKTTRMMGHVSARGKRTQARRDSGKK
jgi:hypothetical protein